MIRLNFRLPCIHLDTALPMNDVPDVHRLRKEFAKEELKSRSATRSARLDPSLGRRESNYQNWSTQRNYPPWHRCLSVLSCVLDTVYVFLVDARSLTSGGQSREEMAHFWPGDVLTALQQAIISYTIPQQSHRPLRSQAKGA